MNESQSARYGISICLTEPLLASSPADPEVYKRFIEERKGKDQKAAGEEVETLPAEQKEVSGWSVFHRDEKGLFLFDYKLRGFMKAAAEAVTGKTGLSAYKSKIDKWVFVFPRRIYLMSGDGLALNSPSGVKETSLCAGAGGRCGTEVGSTILQSPAGVLERPIRAMTMQGPRTSVKRSDYVEAGTKLSAELKVLPLGRREITESRLREWFDYGELQGFGEWRTGSYGRFTYTLELIA